MLHTLRASMTLPLPLAQLGPDAQPCAGALVRACGDPEEEVRQWATAAVEALARAVAGPADLSVRQRAAWALGEVGPAAAAALPTLRQAVADSDPRFSRLAQQAMGQIGGQ